MQSEVLFYTIPEKVKGGFEVNMGCVLVYQYTRNETLTNCITTPCMDVKTIGIPLCTGTPGQPQNFFISFVMELWDCCDLLCFMH